MVIKVVIYLGAAVYRVLEQISVSEARLKHLKVVGGVIAGVHSILEVRCVTVTAVGVIIGALNPRISCAFLRENA